MYVFTTPQDIVKLYSIADVMDDGGTSRAFKTSCNKVIKEFSIRSLEGGIQPKKLPPFTGHYTPLFTIFQEYRLLKKWPHIQTFGFYTNFQKAWIVYEYLEGELAEILYLDQDELTGDIYGTMPLDKVKEFVVQICQKLITLHDIGYAHGDLRAWNILENKGQFEILDFGGAINLKTPPTVQEYFSYNEYGEGRVGLNSIIVINAYDDKNMNHAERSLIWVRNDLWGLGITLYELTAEHAGSIIYGTTSEKYIPLATRCSSLNYLVNEILLNDQVSDISLEDVIDIISK